MSEEGDLEQARKATKVTLRDLAHVVVTTYDVRLRGAQTMLAFERAMNRMRAWLIVNRESVPRESSEPLSPPEVQAMAHISQVLGVLSESARYRTLVVVALALAPDVFSGSEYAKLIERAKGGQRLASAPGSSGHGTEQA